METKHKFSLLLLIVFISENFAFAYNLKQINNNNNLSNSSVTTLCQNGNGLMLIGTCDGLNIYNSRDVIAYKPQNNNQFLSGTIIDKIVCTQNDTYWIQTYYGLNKLNLSTNTVSHFKDFQKLFFMEKDQYGNLFIIKENNCIYYYHTSSTSFKKVLLSGVTFAHIVNFHIDSSNIIRILTNKGYDLSYKILENRTTGEVSLTPIRNRLYIKYKIRYCFSEDNQIYIIDNNYDLHCIDLKTNKDDFVTNLKNDILNRGKVSAIIKDNKNYFVGFQTKGLILLEKQQNSSEYKTKEIEINNGVFCIKKDRLQNIIWIGTDGKGVFIYSNTAYSIRSNVLNNLTHKIERPVRALFLDNLNTLWIGSKGDGILKFYDYDVNKSIYDCKIEAINTTNSSLSDNIVYAFAKSKKNILWIGTEEGLNYYSYKTRLIKRVDMPDKKIPFRFIHDIYETSDNKLWLASLGYGIYRADIIENGSSISLQNIKRYTINNHGFESNYFFSIFVENDSKIWFANRGYGAFYYNAKDDNLSPIIIKSENSTKTINDVFCINKDDQNNLLIGTGYGLIKHSTTSENKIFNSSNGFLNNSIHSIQKEDLNSFWLSTNKGMIRFDSKKNVFRTFDKIDGLEIFEFSDGASFKDVRNGILFFGGINGFVAIQKDLGHEEQYMPKISFDKLTIFGENQNISEKLTNYKGKDQLRLKYQQNFFSVSFTAIDYINGGNYTYFYKIDGISDQWINNGTSNVASFTNVSPGEYTLLVKYYNRTLDKESLIYSLSIRIYPPWYRSFWAYLIYITLFITFGTYLIKLLIAKQQIKKQLLFDEIDKKHQKEVFESKLQFFMNIAHEFCTPLTLISGPCERILSQQGLSKFITNYVQIIQANAGRLNSLINELIEFRRIETGNREIINEPLDIINVTNEILDLFTDMAKSKKIGIEFISSSSLLWNTDKGFYYTIISNLVSNAFKYTLEGGIIKIKIAQVDDNLQVIVSNQGTQINEEDFKRIFDRYTILNNFESRDNVQSLSRNGLGLAITYNMVKLLNGEIVVKNTEDNFIEFKVTLPKIEKNNQQQRTQLPLSLSIQDFKQHKTIKLPHFEFNKLKPTMLIVDDDIEILWLIGEIFSTDFNIITTNEAKRIDSILSDISPNIIISDILMPDTSGIELTKKIKAKNDTSHIPVILISGNYEIDQQIEALEAGAEMYINKPFNTKYLKTSVQQIIERKETLKNYFNSPLSSYDLSEGRLTHKEHKKFLQTVLNIINSNITNEDLSIQFIADKLGMGSRSLYRKMEEIGENSLASLIKECRLHTATDLLIKSKMTIDEIIYKSGFSNKVTFFKAFNKKYGCTPKEFRKKHEESMNSPYEN